ncbi:MAG: ComEC/Rec2 family competence protein [Chitinispirillaceae bacterium]|nr:ComEC/Rec2 family competence protein [Chitinispirillaceae bacterium]
MTPSFRTTVSRIFPLLVHWSDLGALGGAAAFAFGICCAAMTPLRPFLLHKQLYPVFLPAAILCIAAGIITGTKNLRFLAFGAAGAMAYLFQMAQCQQVDACILLLPPGSVRMSGVIITPPEPRRDEFAFLFLLNEIDGKRHPHLSGRTYLSTSAELPPASGSLIIDGCIRSGEPRKNRYDFDESAFLAARGIAGRIAVARICTAAPPGTFGGRVAAKFRSWLLIVFKQYKNPDHRALIRASFTGEKAYIAPEIKAMFQRSGLYHLLALSGFHAALLLTAVYCILAAFPVRSGIKHSAALLVLWLYFGFIGPIPSLTRSIIMATAVIVSMMLQKKNYPLQTFGIAGLVWLIVSPASLFGPGFQLSYAATFGILTLHPLMMKRYRGVAHPIADYFLRPLLTSLSVSFAAFGFTLPILLHHFGTVSLYGLFANIAAIPLMSAAMWAFFTALLSAPLVSWVSQAAVTVSGVMIDCLLMIAGFADRIAFSLVSTYAPYSEIIAGFYALLLAAVAIERSMRRMLLAWGIPLLLCALPADYLIRRAVASPSIVRFATGRNAAVTAVRWASGNTWLFCSGKEPAVRASLHRSVAGWIHHTPGTTIDRLLVAAAGKMPTDSSRAGGRRQLGDIDTFKMVNPVYRCTCSFIPREDRSTLVVTCDRSRLVNGQNGSMVIMHPSDAARQQTLHAPFEAIVRKGRFTIRPFD